MKLDESLRVLGSGGVIIAYFIILHVDSIIGALLHLIADGISVPYFIRTKSWDVVIMITFLTCISTTKLLSGTGFLGF